MWIAWTRAHPNAHAKLKLHASDELDFPTRCRSRVGMRKHREKKDIHAVHPLMSHIATRVHSPPAAALPGQKCALSARKNHEISLR